MSEAFMGGGGNGLVQYGKDDCTYGANQKLFLPSGITFGDILLMRIKQFSPIYTGANAILYKSTDTQISGTSEFTVAVSSTSIQLPMDYSSNSWCKQTCLADTIVECIIIVKK